MWCMFFLSELMTWRRKSRGWLLVLLFGVGAAGCGASEVQAPPAKVAFESPLFRILDVNVPPGATLRHTYQNGVAMVGMTDGGRIRSTSSGGNWGDETASSIGSVTVAQS